MGKEFKLLVREVPGRQVKDLVSTVLEHNMRERCGRPHCLPCDSEELGSKGACWRNSPTYVIDCGACREDGKVAQYVGESGFLAYTRWGTHRASLVAEDNRSALWEHIITHHDGIRGDGVKHANDFTMKVTGSHRSSSRRLISEGILIKEELKEKEERKKKKKETLVLNGRREWFQPRVVKVRATGKLYY